jgi:hypothetical protein
MNFDIMHMVHSKVSLAYMYVHVQSLNYVSLMNFDIMSLPPRTYIPYMHMSDTVHSDLIPLSHSYRVLRLALISVENPEQFTTECQRNHSVALTDR